MQQGAITPNEPRLLAHALLGSYSSVWHWYRPIGAVALNTVADFFIGRILAMVGLSTTFEMKPMAGRSGSEAASGPIRSRSTGVNRSVTTPARFRSVAPASVPRRRPTTTESAE